jgi:hypothetical protein
MMQRPPETKAAAALRGAPRGLRVSRQCVSGHGTTATADRIVMMA